MEGPDGLMGQCTCTIYRDTDELEAELVRRMKDTVEPNLMYVSNSFC